MHLDEGSSLIRVLPVPTKLPRTTLALSPALHTVLQRLAKVQDKSLSSVVRELMEPSVPYLEHVADSMEAIQAADQQARAQMLEVSQGAARSLVELEPHVTALLEHLEAITRVSGGAGAPAEAPTGAATGRASGDSRRTPDTNRGVRCP